MSDLVDGAAVRALREETSAARTNVEEWISIDACGDAVLRGIGRALLRVLDAIEARLRKVEDRHG